MPSRPQTLTLLTVLALSIPSPADARTSIATEGDCRQIAAFVPVPVENVRSLVPASFAIVGEEAGTAQVLVTGGRCEPWTLDGRSAKPLTFGLVSVLAHPREGAPGGADGYDLWWVFGQSDTNSAWRSLGIFSRRVRGTSFEVERGPTGGVTAANASVPWARSPFEIRSTVLDVPPRPLELPSAHWYEGPRGRVFGDHANTEGGVLPASVTIETPVGSPLAEIMGASNVTLPGGYLEFHHSAVTGIAG